MKKPAEIIPGHRISWFVVVDGVKIPKQSTMRGMWGYDVKCECGWETRTGGAVKSYIADQISGHKWDVKVECAGGLAAYIEQMQAQA